MTSPFPAEAIRELVSSRIRAAIGEMTTAEREQTSRDALLPPLLALTAAAVSDGDSIAEQIADAATSVALAVVEEEPTLRMSVLLASVQLLLEQGDFARVGSLLARAKAVAAQLESMRPFVGHFACALLESVSKDDGKRRAAALLRRVLGLEPGAPQERAQRRNPTQIGDVLVAACLKEFLDRGESGQIDLASRYSLGTNNALAFACASALAGYVRASGHYSLRDAVVGAVPGFGAPPFDAMLDRLPERLFPAQLLAVHDGLFRSRNAVIAVPTGTGKTLMAALRIAQSFAIAESSRVVYIAPYKLLARQVEVQLQDCLGALGRSVRDLGGDFDADVEQPIGPGALPDVGILTPERLDGLMRLANSEVRGATEAAAFLDGVKLVVVDEAHIVGSDSRGVRSELTIARLRQRNPDAALVALTGATTEVTQLADWMRALTVGAGGRRATGAIELLWREDGRLVYRRDTEPVSVATIPRQASQLHSAALLARRCATDLRPVLILETQRAWAEQVATSCAEGDPSAGERFILNLAADERARIHSVASSADATLGQGSRLGMLLRSGIAYHHAGLPTELLRAIEGLASARLLRIVATTTTVAEGSDLPFRVVIIPHLTFPSRQPIDAGLYRNITGRAGRPGVSHEGIVIVLASSAPTLRRYVERQLWNQDPAMRGQMPVVQRAGRTLHELRRYRDLESQVLAWLGDEGAYGDNQATRLASATFSWVTAGDDEARGRMVGTVAEVLQQLETRGFAEAGSPLSLTDAGRRARLSGLSPASCTRLRPLVESLDFSAIGIDDGVSTLAEETASAIAGLVCQSEEVLSRGLWFGRAMKQDPAVLRELEDGTRDWPVSDDVFQADQRLLAMWISGAQLSVIGAAAPTFERGAFSSGEPTERAEDAQSLFTDIAPTAAWVWSGIVALAGRSGTVPYWIRRAIEFGVPTETATQLVRRVHTSRHAALLVSRLLPPVWEDAATRVRELENDRVLSLGVTQADAERLARWRSSN